MWAKEMAVGLLPRVKMSLHQGHGEVAVAEQQERRLIQTLARKSEVIFASELAEKEDLGYL